MRQDKPEMNTGFKEIDDVLGGINQGEVVLIATNGDGGNILKRNILYHLARILEDENRKITPHYERIIKRLSKYYRVILPRPLCFMTVIGRSGLGAHVPAVYPYTEAPQSVLRKLEKELVLFNGLPIEEKSIGWRWRSCKDFMAALTKNEIYNEVSRETAVLCCFEHIDKLPFLKEAADKLHIPVLVFVEEEDPLEIKKVSKHLGRFMKYVDKYIGFSDNYWLWKKENERVVDGSEFLIKKMNGGEEVLVSSLFFPNVLLEDIIEWEETENLKEDMCLKFLKKMAENDCYLNRYNFSRYLGLKGEKEKKFWARVTMLQRVLPEELQQLMAEYRQEEVKDELQVAAYLLSQMLGTSEEITVSYKEGRNRG